MSDTESNVHLWNHLLSTAELLESLEGPQTRELVMEQLNTIVEAFGDCADPVENFEEFVVIKLSQAICSALTADQQLPQANRTST